MASIRGSGRLARAVETATKTRVQSNRTFVISMARRVNIAATYSSRSTLQTSPRLALNSARRFQSTYAQPAPPFYSDDKPGRTALYDLHVEHGGKMVPFGGFEMPVQYSDLSITESHHWTRAKASLFDVGHMVQYHVEGPGAESFLESITPAGVKDLEVGQSTLSALLHPVTGGIGDDCIITRLGDGPNPLFYVVLNAGCREKDFKFLSSALQNWDNTVNPVVQLRHLEASRR